MPSIAYNLKVAARTDFAAAILADPQALEQWCALGGLPTDLEAIVADGREAEALNLSQQTAKADGSAATAAVALEFAALQRDYKATMRPLEMIYADLEREKAPNDQLKRLKGIIANEAQIAVRTFEQDGVKKKRAVKMLSHEAVRAEIERDAKALLEFEAIKDRLAARTVSPERLKGLQDRAAALTGKLSDRVGKKNVAKNTTKAERDAVARQSQRWVACFRVFGALAQVNGTVRDMLKPAMR